MLRLFVVQLQRSKFRKIFKIMKKSRTASFKRLLQMGNFNIQDRDGFSRKWNFSVFLHTLRKFFTISFKGKKHFSICHMVLKYLEKKKKKETMFQQNEKALNNTFWNEIK